MLQHKTTMGAPKNTALIPYVVLLGLVGFVGFGSSTLEQDKAECGEKLVGLATCLNFVGGQASSPTPDCCRGLKTVVEKSTKCLCVLVKDRNDPKLDIKFNVTRALQLPSTCHVPLNLTTCVDLLRLAPNSKDAKVFEDFAKSLKNGTSTSASPAARTGGNPTSHGNPAAEVKSNGGKGKRWNHTKNMGVLEMTLATYLLWFFINPHDVTLYV